MDRESYSSLLIASVSSDAYVFGAIDVKTLITARRFETLTVHQLVQGFSTSECDWLAGAHSTDQKRVSVSDALKRRELLEEFLFWYFDGFLIPLIRVSSYRNSTKHTRSYDS